MKVIEIIGLHKVEFAVLALILAIIINLILRIKFVVIEIKKITDDTLKVYDAACKCRRYSGTKLTMVVAFGSTLWSYHFITVKNGFNETAFMVMAAIATGVGITKAFSKKLDPEITAPDTQTTIKQETTENTEETTIKKETTS